MQEPPFIAVGGGLAGAAFALELARNGAPVSVLESTRGPHHKVCGEFLSAEAQGLIAYLGIDLAALGATSIGRFRLAAAGRRADAPLPFRAAGLSRHLLDQAMLQAAEKAGIPLAVHATTINKVCLSGLQTIYLADLMVRAGEADIVVAGGMESMTNAPYLVPRARWGARIGDAPVVDAMIHDGLWSTFTGEHMGESSDRVNAEGRAR